MMDPFCLVAGYPSLDYLIQVDKEVKEGRTCHVRNTDHRRAYPGGCALNIACALNRLGLRTFPIFRVGGDYSSSGLEDFFHENNIPEDGLTQVEEANCSSTYLLETAGGEHSTLFYEGAMEDRYALKRQSFPVEGAALGIITVNNQRDNLAFFQACQAAGVPVAFSMKSDSRAFPKDFLRQLLQQSSMLFMNAREGQEICETYGLPDLKSVLTWGQAKFLICSQGSDGCSLYVRNEGDLKHYWRSAYNEVNVVDSSGAGDALVAGFIYAYLRGMEARLALDVGQILASFVLEGRGCCTNLPRAEQLVKRLSYWGLRR